jgi:crotonobetainyl-CoA:carnitine CoA-transferase CaiB-like acyl-CoA transferase
MTRWGLGASKLTEVLPSLVYLSLPGFPSTNTEMAQVQAWEGVVLSAAGAYSDMNLNRTLCGKSPSYFALPIASANGAALGAVGVMAALIARQETGRGDAIEVPLLDAVLPQNGLHRFDGSVSARSRWRTSPDLWMNTSPSHRYHGRPL